MLSISSWLRWLFIWSSLAVSSHALAVTEYTWGGAGFGSGHPSAVAACQAGIPGFDPDGTYEKVVINLPFAQCYWRSWNGELRSSPNQMVRNGDGCLPGKTYNAATGGCEAPSNSCLAKAGSTTRWSVTGKTTDPSPPVKKVGSVYVFTRPPVIDGCELNVLTGSSCRFKADDSFVCVGQGQFTGNEAATTTDTVPDSLENDPEPGESSQEAECTSWTTDAEGRRHMTCETSVTNSVEGGSQCGTVDVGAGTEFRCIKPSPTPTSTKEDTTENVTKEDTPDGGEKTTTETTVTKTYCAAGACTTTTTTNVSNTTTNAAGETTSSSGSCTGAGCDKPTQPDEQKEEEPAPDATGLACAEALACTGDAIQCALLRTEKEQKCAAEEAGDYDAVKDDIDALVQGEQFQMEEDTTDFSALFNTGTRFLPSACPVDVPISLSSGRNLHISWQPLCNMAETLGFLFVAMTSLFFIRYVGSALGGE